MTILLQEVMATFTWKYVTQAIVILAASKPSMADLKLAQKICTFAFSAEFQKCLESSKKLYYFLGITGTDGWKSNGLEIYFDGLTKEVCTLDGGKWLDGDSDNPEGKLQPRLPLNCQK